MTPFEAALKQHLEQQVLDLARIFGQAVPIAEGEIIEWQTLKDLAQALVDRALSAKLDTSKVTEFTVRDEAGIALTRRPTKVRLRQSKDGRELTVTVKGGLLESLKSNERRQSGQHVPSVRRKRTS